MNQSGFQRLLVLTIFASIGFAMLSSGCGTVQEGTEEEEWTSTPPFSVTARLEYRVDSLLNENRKLQQQYEAVAAENKNLSARNTELEARAKETAVTPPSSMPLPSTTTRTSGSPSGGYEAAMQKYRTRRYQEAVEHFGSLVNSGISDDLLDNCYYWIGESHFAMRRYNDAIQQFEIVAGMSNSDKTDDAQYMIGNSYLQIGRTDAAREAFQRLIQQFPSSPLVKRARAKMPSL